MTAPASGDVPTGTVTFLLTDVEGSTRLWAADSAAMSASLLVHDQILRDAIESRGGYVFTTAGDAFAAAFQRASDAVAAASDAQHRLAAAAWPGPNLRVRMGIHLGEAEERAGDYFGPVVNTTARVEAAGHGGQVLITEAVRLAAEVDAIDLGSHLLRDIDEPVSLHQLGGGEFRELRVVNTSMTNLRSRPTRLLGRDDEIARVRQLLTTDRLVTVTAAGGSGKTRLAIAVGEAELLERSDGVWFADLTAVTDGSDLPLSIANAIGLRLSGVDALVQVTEYLAEKNALVILDNCEHVIDDVADFAERVLATPGTARLLATSREALDVDGERTLPLHQLPTDTPDSPGVQLFIDRATVSQPDLALTDDDTETIAAICTRLDGMPLAIELAAARTAAMTPRELLAGLDDRFQLLSSGRRRQRGRTLEATLDWSYDLLDPDEQRSFRALGVFVGGFDHAAAAALVDATPSTVRDMIESLVAKSMVVHSIVDGGSRFRLLETMRAYAEAKLVETGELEAARGRHADHFHTIATVRGRTMAADARIGRALRLDASNITEAVRWMGDVGRWVPAGELLNGSFGVFENYGRATEARQLFQRCQDGLEGVDGELLDALRASSGLCSVVLDDYPGLAVSSERLRASSDARARAIGCGYLAFLNRLTAPAESARLRDEAEQHLVRAHVESPGLNTDLARGLLQYLMGIALGLDGDYRAALAAYDEIPDTDARYGHITGTLNTALPQAAVCHILLGEPEAGVARMRPLADLGYAYGALHEIDAIVHFAVGDAPAAERFVRLHAVEAATGRLHRQCNDAVMLLSELALIEGDADRAVELLAQMGIARSPGTIMYSRALAGRLGQSEARARAERSAADPDSWPTQGVMGATAAMAALRSELARRAWND